MFTPVIRFLYFLQRLTQYHTLHDLLLYFPFYDIATGVMHTIYKSKNNQGFNSIGSGEESCVNKRLNMQSYLKHPFNFQ